MPNLQEAIKAMDKACRIWSVGYDQSQRENIWDGGETDCSALVIWALKQGGFDTGSASYTGNMSSNLTTRGWVRLPADLSTAQPGDILLNDGSHVVMVISGFGWNARIAQASIDERGKISGGQTGDQTGHETNERQIYKYRLGWNCILRYMGGDTKQDPVITGDGDIAIDGFVGQQTIAKLQKAMGTIVDGSISGQDRSNKKYYDRLRSVTFEGNGESSLVKAIQTKFGCTVDGHIGPNTIKAIQQFVGADQDGYFGPDTATKVQQTLVDNKWNAEPIKMEAPTAQTTTPSNNNLKVDGWIGVNSISAWQSIMGTSVDGVISGQAGENKPFLDHIVSIQWDRYGSQLVIAVQRKVGCPADGILGPMTIRYIQRYLGVSDDGYFGHETGCALQQKLNTGSF